MADEEMAQQADSAELTPAQDGLTASMQDLLVVTSGRKQDLAQAFLTFPDTFAEAAGRTRLTEDEIATLSRMMAKYNRFHYGSTRIWEVVHAKLAWRVSLNGEGRREAKEVVIAERRNLLSRMNPFGRIRNWAKGGEDGGMDG